MHERESTNGKFTIQYFDDYLIALNRELVNHPELVFNPGASIEERIASIATYCGVVVDGPFLLGGFKDLCEELIVRLKAKSAGIIL